MNTKIIGQVMLVFGVACGLVYVLASLYRGETIPVPLTATLLYVGIVTLITGLVFCGLAGVRKVPSGKKY